MNNHAVKKNTNIFNFLQPAMINRHLHHSLLKMPTMADKYQIILKAILTRYFLKKSVKTW